MPTVALTGGLIAFVDEQDYANVIAAGSWSEAYRGVRVYARARINGKLVFLHRFILGESDLDIDHEDGNGLNCRRNNIAFKTRTANMLNVNNIKRIDNKSGRKGVYFDTFYGKWKAEMRVKGRKFHLGTHNTIEEAVTAREKAEENIKNGLPPKAAKTRGSRYKNIGLERFSI